MDNLKEWAWLKVQQQDAQDLAHIISIVELSIESK